MITIGIDPHKSTLTAVGLSPDGTILATTRLPVNTTTLGELLAFADSWPHRQWAVEGAAGLGLGIAQRLVAHGQDVVDVPATLAARARLLSVGHGRKTDVNDAATVALVAQHHRRLRRVQAEDLASVIRLVSDHRDDLVAEHTSGVNRLHRLLRDLIPGGAKTGISTRQAADLLRRVRPVTATETARKQLARDLIVGLRALEARTKTLTDQLGALVAQSGTTLTDIPGVASIVAAKVIGHTGDIARFPDQHHFASFNGTAPIDASSGNQTRHRLSRRGDRQLNAAIHVIAIYQISHPGPGRDYYLKKLAEAKTPKEARRALKRRLSDTVYRRLANDHDTSFLAAA
jgi:transposase